MKTLTDVFKNSEKVFEMRGFLICFADRPLQRGLLLQEKFNVFRAISSNKGFMPYKRRETHTKVERQKLSFSVHSSEK